MAEQSVSSVVRDILTGDPEMRSDEVVRRAKAAGLRATDEQIKKSVNNQRNAIRPRSRRRRWLPRRLTKPPRRRPLRWFRHPLHQSP